MYLKEGGESIGTGVWGMWKEGGESIGTGVWGMWIENRVKTGEKAV